MAQKKLPDVAVTVNGEPVVGQEVGERPDDAVPGEPLPMPMPEGGWPADEFSGHGGSYVRDAQTGVRRPAGN